MHQNNFTEFWGYSFNSICSKTDLPDPLDPSLFFPEVRSLWRCYSIVRLVIDQSLTGELIGDRLGIGRTSFFFAFVQCPSASWRLHRLDAKKKGSL